MNIQAGMPRVPSPREYEVLQLICNGLTTKEIAAKLEISLKTAASHRWRIMTKAKAKNAVQLLQWAIKNNFVNL
jgi:DNA-binding CsgD family transcriptional regulator